MSGTLHQQILLPHIPPTKKATQKWITFLLSVGPAGISSNHIIEDLCKLNALQLPDYTH